MSSAGRVAPEDPVLFILGATGTGKSKLAVSLAQSYNGEIVNSDAIQMYRGLPIVTNKISEPERGNVRHHLLDFIELHEQPWTVRQFVRESSAVIEGIRKRGKLPIVVGGTGYYAHGLIFNDATLRDGSEEDDSDGACSVQNGDVLARRDGKGEETTRPSSAEVDSILKEPTDRLFERLQELDPEMAQRWHPRDRRKIQRSLEICLRTEKKASEIYDEQKRQREHEEIGEDGVAPVFGGSSHHRESRLRYKSMILWLEAEDSILKRRLNARVDAMVASGLLEEVTAMREFEKASLDKGVVIDRDKGVWVAIGYKEMEPWLDHRSQTVMDERNLAKLKDDCIESIKAGTRRYAKIQNRYIRLRLANALRNAKADQNLFLLDCSDLDRWQSDVEDPSCSLLEAFFSGQPLPERKTLSDLADRTFTKMDQHDESLAVRQARLCEACNKTLMTEKQWTEHLQTRGHKKVLAASRKRREVEKIKKSHPRVVDGDVASG